MADRTTLHIRQDAPRDGVYPIRLTLERPGRPRLEAQASVDISLTPQEEAEIRWYLEDYLQRADVVEAVVVEQVEALMAAIGIDLYRALLTANDGTQAIWHAVRDQLADLRVEIATGVVEAAAIPWELLRDPLSDSPIALRVAEFVRVQSNPNIDFVTPPPVGDGRIRLLYVVCRPGGAQDVGLRAVANRLLQGLGAERARFAITTLRPPTFERLQRELTDAAAAGRPYHIVHFDGHGTYEDLSGSSLAEWLAQFSPLLFGGERRGKRGYLLFEHPNSPQGIRPVAGEELGQLLHDCRVPVLILNACQSAMHEARERPAQSENVHDEVRAIGSLAQAVIDQGIPGVLGMRYSVYVVTAAQFIGELYAGLGRGWGFGQAANEARKHLQRNPERWLGLQPRILQDWFVPVVHEAAPLPLLPAQRALALGGQPELDPVQTNPELLPYVPETGFIGRDETLLLLDRAFDAHPVVLLYAYAGQGKSSAAVEFARWYCQTGGLGEQPVVLFTSFAQPTTLDELLAQAGARFAPVLRANGIEWHALNRPGERRALVLQLLRHFPVLWIWDNVEPVAGFPAGTASQWSAAEQAELAGFLRLIREDRATQARILLTSRREEGGWLGGTPQRVPMPPLSPADAARLALSLGQERRLSRAEIGDWQPLLDYCGGNPLTLRVLVGQAVKMGLRGKEQLAAFVQAVRDGEQRIEDVDAAQGRERSLGASLDYGFRNAFAADELPVIALLHLFQGTVSLAALALMGVGEYALPELRGMSPEALTGLLNRAAETGLLTRPISNLQSPISSYYTIHPALPWFLAQLFAASYDGQAARSPAQTAARAWVEAMGALGDYYHRQFNEGNRQVIRFLQLEEANLLHARRTARRNGWWDPVTSAMQGLDELYGYQGRGDEWARLVAEIVPDFCTATDEPAQGREEEYTLVMGYRVRLAQEQERNLEKAARLQGKLVALHRRQAGPALARGAEVDKVQRNRIRTLSASVFTLGQILMEQGDPDCVVAYQETIPYMQRIGDRAAEAIAHLNLGHAYLQLPAIRNLDAAEAAYQRSLELREANDALGRSGCIQQIGMVHHERFNEARQQGAAEATQLRHVQAAEGHYLQALALRPPTAIGDLGPLHNNLGALYKNVGQIERARQHYEQDVQICIQTGDTFGAGQTRYNLALMYRDAAGREASPSARTDLLRRALAYAQSSLRDYQHFQGRAAADEADAQRLIGAIEAALISP